MAQGVRKKPQMESKHKSTIFVPFKKIFLLRSPQIVSGFGWFDIKSDSSKKEKNLFVGETMMNVIVLI